MSTGKWIVLSLLLLICAGCKLVIVVPEGGTVTTASGKQVCAAGATCVIDVSDFTFNELFFTLREPGVRFVGWKAGNRGLCGGSQLPCNLTTVPLVGVAAVEAILESDTRFFLEPRARDIRYDSKAARERSQWSHFLWLGNQPGAVRNQQPRV